MVNRLKSISLMTLLSILIISSNSIGFTCPGSEAGNTNSNGNYVLGMPIGGIGAGNFNFLPDGKYNKAYIRVGADDGAMPLCIAYQKRGSTMFSGNLQQDNGMTTTFTGYWPTVKMKYMKSDIIDSIGLECFSPICTGDNLNSSLPIAFYIFTIENSGTASDTVAVALSNGANSTIIRSGNVIRGIKSGSVCVMVDTTKTDPADSVTCGSTASDFTSHGLLNNGNAGILAKRVIVAPKSTATIAFCVSWTNVNNGYYRKYFTDAQAIASYGIDSVVILKGKVDNWHNKILNSNLPEWLKDLAVNCLHVYNCMTDWVTPNTYGMQEAMSESLYGTNDQAFHASLALGLFAPDAEWSQVSRMAECEGGNGLFSHLYGGADGIRSDVGGKFVLETYRAYQWTGNTSNLNGLYGNIAKAIDGIHGEDNNGDGLTDDNNMTTYDNAGGDWNIPSKEYDNEIYLGALKAAVSAASALGKPADSAKFAGYFNATSASFEKNNGSGFWDSTRQSSSGRKGYYSGSTNTGANGKAVWDGGLLGQWGSDLCGLGPLHPENRIESALKMINDACLDQRNPPCYALMQAYPDVNCTGNGPQGTFFNNTCVTYCAYPAGDLCAGFGHNCPDIAMRALHSFWNITFNKYKRVYNMPCKFNADGAGTDWGINRYMNPPACFAALFGITGFSIDVNAKILRLKPSLPTSSQYKMDSLVNGPLINPVSCGTLDYKQDVATGIQNMFVKFDSPMQFGRIYVKKQGPLQVAVTKNGASIAAKIAVNPSDTSEFEIAFASPITIDNSGIKIAVGVAPSSVGHLSQTAQKPIRFDAVLRSGSILVSYTLAHTARVSLSLINSLGIKTSMVPDTKGFAAAGDHSITVSTTKIPAGVYYATMQTDDLKFSKKIVITK